MKRIYDFFPLMWSTLLIMVFYSFFSGPLLSQYWQIPFLIEILVFGMIFILGILLGWYLLNDAPSIVLFIIGIGVCFGGFLFFRMPKESMLICELEKPRNRVNCQLIQTSILHLITHEREFDLRGARKQHTTTDSEGDKRYSPVLETPRGDIFLDECPGYLAREITEYIDNPIDNEFIFTCTDFDDVFTSVLLILVGFATLYFPLHGKIIKFTEKLRRSSKSH